MMDFGQAVAWLVLSPIACITSVVALFIVAHYKPFFHAADLAFLSLFSTMALNSVLILPVPAIVYLSEITWNIHLCNFYVWATITFRVAELLGLMCLSFYWVLVFRCPADKKWYISTKVTKFVIFAIWFLAIIAGILPSIGATQDSLAEDKECRFLPYDLGDGFAVFFLILTCFAMCMCFICTLDTMMLLRHMKRVAVVKYHAGRFCMPSSSASITATSQTVHNKYNELTFSADLCRLLIYVITISACINHFPYMIIEFMQLVQSPNRKLSEVVVLWLLLIETLTLPHALWLVSKRYRHALVYTWRVYVVRDTAVEEEDASACTLQSYTRKVRDEDGGVVRVIARANGRQMINNSHLDRPVTNGTPHRMNGQRSVTQTPNHFANVKQNGRATEIFTTDLDDGMTVVTNTCSGQVHYIADGSSNTSKSGTRSSTSASTTPSKSSLGTPSHGQDLRRTLSARLEWKEQMRRKHLPAIFVNEAFDSDLPSPEKVLNSPKKHSHKVSDVSLYYMSSDYHPDQLVDVIPKLPHQESEGVYNQYEDKDFEYLLDEANAVADTSMSKDIEQAFHSVLQSEALNSVTEPHEEMEHTPIVTETDNSNTVLQESDYNSYIEADNSNTVLQEYEYNGTTNADNSNTFVQESEYKGTTEADNSNTIAQESYYNSTTETQPDHDSTSSCEITNNRELHSESSDHSITIEPYTEGRRPPWMDDDFDSSFSGMIEPLIGESDADTLKDSNGSSVFEMGNSEIGGISVASPAQFDDETERGFEDALSYNYAYGHSTSLGLCFESIKEEPEETFSDSSPFGRDEEVSAIFKTQAIISSRSPSRASTDNPTEHAQECKQSVSVNGFNEFDEEQHGSREHEENYNCGSTRLGMFYNTSYPEESSEHSAHRDTVGYSMSGHGNVEETTSFRHGDDVSIVTNSYDQNNDQLTLDINNTFSTLGHGGNPFVESKSVANINGYDCDVQHNYDCVPVDSEFSQERMRSQLPERREVNYNGFLVWPEEDIEMSDRSFDSDFSQISTDKSNPSEIPGPIVIGQKNQSDPVNNLSPRTNNSDMKTAFF